MAADLMNQSISQIENFNTIPYVVWLGDVGSGKSTLAEKLTGLTGLGSNKETSFTLSSKIYMTPCHQLMFCDTPGANAMADKFKNNMNIATAISYRPLSRIMIVVKADVRIDNMIETIRKYMEGFIDSENMEEIISICVTHMDLASWTEKILLDHVNNEFGFKSVIFSGLDTTRDQLLEDILKLCTKFHNISVNEDNFFKMFKINNNNLKILKAIRREVDDIRDLHKEYLIQKKMFDSWDLIDLAFEYQAYMEEMINDSQKRFSDECDFTFMNPETQAAELAHYANLTNQLKTVLYEVRIGTLTYANDHGAGDLRQCPHCGEIWAKIIGCEGQTTCGNLCRFADTKGKDHVRDFANFTFERVGKKFVIKRGGIRARNKNNNVENNTGKRGCGRYINWSSMQPVPVPPEFDAKVDISVEDVEVVPQNAKQSWGNTFREASAYIIGALTTSLDFATMGYWRSD